MELYMKGIPLLLPNKVLCRAEEPGGPEQKLRI